MAGIAGIVEGVGVLIHPPAPSTSREFGVVGRSGGTLESTLEITSIAKGGFCNPAVFIATCTARCPTSLIWTPGSRPRPANTLATCSGIRTTTSIRSPNCPQKRMENENLKKQCQGEGSPPTSSYGYAKSAMKQLHRVPSAMQRADCLRFFPLDSPN
jgi:hypothetical protein